MQDLVGALLIDSSEIDFTYTDATPSITASLKNASVVFARLQDADALSVLGRASNTSGVLDEIAAGTDHQVLRRSGTAIAFGALNLAQAAAITGDLPFANLAQITGPGVLGVAASGTADLAAISAGTNDRVLRQTASVLNFGQLTAGMFPNTVVPDAALSSNVPLKDVANIFSARQEITATSVGNDFSLDIRAAIPGILLVSTGQASNAKNWRVFLSNADFRIQTETDTGTGADLALEILRSGTTVTNFNVVSTAISLTGATTLNGATQRVTGPAALARWIMDTTTNGAGDLAYHLFSIGGNTKAFYGVGPIFGAATTADFCLNVASGAYYLSFDNGTTTHAKLSAARADFNMPVQLFGYTVATLPAGTVGDTAYVTDALAPAFLTAVVGGGAVKTPVFYDGTNWVAM